MAWDKTKPASTDILATSQGDIVANWTALEGVLGSGTLSSGLSIVQGNILYGSAANTLSVLAPGTDGYFLKSQGAAADPVWTSFSGVIDQAAIAASAVGQGELKSTTGEVSTSFGSPISLLFGFCESVSGTLKESANYGSHIASYTTHAVISHTSGTNVHKTLPGGEYGFVPQVKATGGVAYIQQRYIQASGPDHWLFFLVDKETRKIISSWSSPDHPSYGQGFDEKGMPHPFTGVDLEKNDVILADNDFLEEAKKRVTSKRSLLTVINEDYEIDEESNIAYKTREIVELDELGDKKGEIIRTLKTPEWAKIKLGVDTITIKKRKVKNLPSYIKNKKIKKKVGV